jgi:hypothetical protein
MKAAAILAVTTAFSLGGVVVLFVQQQELKEQLAGGGRVAAAESPRAADPVVISRLERLEQQVRAEPVPVPAPVSAAAPGEGGGSRESLPAFAEEEAAAEGYDPVEMERFRRKVKRAIELNLEEEQRLQVMEQIDRMVERGAIGAMSAPQKERVAKTVIASRAKARAIWPRIFGTPENRELPMEQRREMVRAEMETLRAEAQKELETIIPAADAKKIADEQLQQARGLFAGTTALNTLFPESRARGG